MLTNGQVFVGTFHGDALETASAAHANNSDSYYKRLFKDSEDGFITSRGRFVRRDEAYQIAVETRQMTRKSYADALSDLWGRQFKNSRELGALAFNNARRDNR